MPSRRNSQRLMKNEIRDQFLVRKILEPLPSKVDNVESSYDTPKEVLDLNNMIAIVTQEEEILEAGRSHLVLMMTQA